MVRFQSCVVFPCVCCGGRMITSSSFLAKLFKCRHFLPLVLLLFLFIRSNQQMSFYKFHCQRYLYPVSYTSSALHVVHSFVGYVPLSFLTPCSGRMDNFLFLFHFLQVISVNKFVCIDFLLCHCFCTDYIYCL